MNFVALYADDAPESWRQPVPAEILAAVSSQVGGQAMEGLLVFACPQCQLAHEYQQWITLQPPFRNGFPIVGPLIQHPSTFAEGKPVDSIISWNASMHQAGFPGWETTCMVFTPARVQPPRTA